MNLCSLKEKQTQNETGGSIQNNINLMFNVQKFYYRKSYFLGMQICNIPQERRNSFTIEYHILYVRKYLTIVAMNTKFDKTEQVCFQLIFLNR